MSKGLTESAVARPFQQSENSDLRTTSSRFELSVHLYRIRTLDRIYLRIFGIKSSHLTALNSRINWKLKLCFCVLSGLEQGVFFSQNFSKPRSPHPTSWLVFSRCVYCFRVGHVAGRTPSSCVPTRVMMSRKRGLIAQPSQVPRVTANSRSFKPVGTFLLSSISLPSSFHWR